MSGKQLEGVSVKSILFGCGLFLFVSIGLGAAYVTDQREQVLQQERECRALKACSTITRCKVEPQVCLHVVLQDALAVVIRDTEAELGNGDALLGSQAKPLHCFGVVLG